MKRKRIVVLFVALVLSVLAVATLLGPTRRASLVSAAEDKPKGKLTKVFRKNQSNTNDPLPDWVDQTFKIDEALLKLLGLECAIQVVDIEAELVVAVAREVPYDDP